MNQWTKGRAVASVLSIGVFAVGVSACGSTVAGGASSSASVPSPTSTVPTEAVIGLTVDQATTWAMHHSLCCDGAHLVVQRRPLQMRATYPSTASTLNAPSSQKWEATKPPKKALCIKRLSSAMHWYVVAPDKYKQTLHKIKVRLEDLP